MRTLGAFIMTGLLVAACSAGSPPPATSDGAQAPSASLAQSPAATLAATVAASPSPAAPAFAWRSAGALTGGPVTRFTATLLADGRVLVAGGGIEGPSGRQSTKTAQIFDPTSNTWAATAPMPHARRFHAATLLTDGRVLVTGGFDEDAGGAIAAVDVFDPSNGRWSTLGSMSTPRNAPTAIRLCTPGQNCLDRNT